MDCPKCVGIMEPRQIETETIQLCPVCGGLWLENGQLQKILDSDAANLHYLDLGQEDYKEHQYRNLGVELETRTGQCPVCDRPLRTVPCDENPRVLLERCENGHGTWLAAGAIQRLRRRGFVKLFHTLKALFSGEGIQTWTGRWGAP